MQFCSWLKKRRERFVAGCAACVFGDRDWQLMLFLQQLKEPFALWHFNEVIH
jgi:hypothetical protein